MGIAQVLMSLGALRAAVNSFHELNDAYGSLPPWLLMDLTECYALLRQLDAAEAVYHIAPPEASEQFPEPALPMSAKRSATCWHAFGTSRRLRRWSCATGTMCRRAAS